MMPEAAIAFPYRSAIAVSRGLELSVVGHRQTNMLMS
jgi:hypothetical protein